VLLPSWPTPRGMLSVQHPRSSVFPSFSLLAAVPLLEYTSISPKKCLRKISKNNLLRFDRLFSIEHDPLAIYLLVVLGSGNPYRSIGFFVR
jgi:hypothetical protein